MECRQLLKPLVNLIGPWYCLAFHFGHFLGYLLRWWLLGLYVPEVGCALKVLQLLGISVGCCLFLPYTLPVLLSLSPGRVCCHLVADGPCQDICHSLWVWWAHRLTSALSSLWSYFCVGAKGQDGLCRMKPAQAPDLVSQSFYFVFYSATIWIWWEQNKRSRLNQRFGPHCRRVLSLVLLAIVNMHLWSLFLIANACVSFHNGLWSRPGDTPPPSGWFIRNRNLYRQEAPGSR